MQVNIKDLYLGEHHYNTVNNVEEEIADVLREIVDYNADIKMAPKKFFEGYDFKLGEARFELKISSNPIPWVEYARADGTDSGLSKTRADFYCFVCPSKLKDGNSWVDVFKIRIVETNYLKSVMKSSMSKIVFPASQHGPGAKCFGLDFKEHDHMWMGNFKSISKYVFETDGYQSSYGIAFKNNIRKIKGYING